MVVGDVSGLLSCFLRLSVNVLPESYLCVICQIVSESAPNPVFISPGHTAFVCVHICVLSVALTPVRWDFELCTQHLKQEKLIIGLHCTYVPPSVLCIPRLFLNIHLSRKLSLSGIRSSQYTESSTNSEAAGGKGSVNNPASFRFSPVWEYFAFDLWLLKLHQVYFDANPAQQQSNASAANTIKGTRVLKAWCALCADKSHYFSSFLPLSEDISGTCGFIDSKGEVKGRFMNRVLFFQAFQSETPFSFFFSAPCADLLMTSTLSFVVWLFCFQLLSAQAVL